MNSKRGRQQWKLQLSIAFLRLDNVHSCHSTQLVRSPDSSIRVSWSARGTGRPLAHSAAQRTQQRPQLADCGYCRASTDSDSGILRPVSEFDAQVQGHFSREGLTNYCLLKATTSGLDFYNVADISTPPSVLQKQHFFFLDMEFNQISWITRCDKNSTPDLSDSQHSKCIITLLEKETGDLGCQVSSIWGFRVTKFGRAGSGFLALGVSCTESEENAPQRDMFIVQWVWGSLFGTQCLVCLEPTLDIKRQGELAHGWLEASLPGCYQGTHTHAITRPSAERRLLLRVWCAISSFSVKEKQ